MLSSFIFCFCKWCFFHSSLSKEHTLTSCHHSTHGMFEAMETMNSWGWTGSQASSFSVVAIQKKDCKGLRQTFNSGYLREGFQRNFTVVIVLNVMFFTFRTVILLHVCINL